MTDQAFRIAVKVIQQFESCRLSPHLDTIASTKGRTVYDIGWGSSTMPDGSLVQAGSPSITQAVADTMLEGHVADVMASIRAMVHTSISANAEAALTSWAYNVGTAAARSSTLMRLLNQGKVQEAADQFPVWVFSGGHFVRGLLTRRQQERSLFLAGTPVTEGIATSDTLSDPDNSADDLNAQELRRLHQS